MRYIMHVVLNKRSIELFDPEVKAAKQIVTNFFEASRKTAEKANRPTYFYTLLVVAHLLSSELLESITADTIEDIVNNDKRKQRDIEARLNKLRKEKGIEK